MKKYIFLTVLLLSVIIVNTAAANKMVTFVEAARSQVGQTVRYDSSYQRLGYPNGDVPMDRGVCTDVIIRALRKAFNYDLQKSVHEDMQHYFSRYPKIWGLSGPDKNIDHRRVPNLQTFFERSGWALPLSRQLSSFRAGDIVTCIVPPNLPHIMIVSDRVGRNKTPLVIHNIGSGTKEENRLLEFKITGHYRIKGVGQGS